MLLRYQMEVQGNFLFKYRGVLPVLLIPPGLALLYFQINSHPSFSWISFFSYYKWVCLATIVLGQLIRFYAIGYTPRSTSGRNTQVQVADVVNSTGIYSCVRHPLYLGNFFMALGVAMLSCDFLFIVIYVLLFWIYYERIMYAEEQFISKKFDQKLENWANKTPTIVPDCKEFQKPNGDFNWKKIIRQEKNGLLGTFAIFVVFQLVENYALHQKAFLGFDFWNIGLLVSGVTYLVVRLLTKKTRVLHD